MLKKILICINFIIFITYASPKISIITSIYKGNQFIKSFLEDIVKQTVFENCELILINAASPENEESVINELFKDVKKTTDNIIIRPMHKAILDTLLQEIVILKEYDSWNVSFELFYENCHYYALAKKNNNIIYIRLPIDPGLYDTWNFAIKIASGEYITNANVDDRVSYNCYEEHAKILDMNPTVDLVYSDLYVTSFINLTAERLIKNPSLGHLSVISEFSSTQITKQGWLPNDHPMWRKSCHERWGYFNEIFKSAGDLEMWLRFLSGGAQFKKVMNVFGIHYLNPDGLSTGRKYTSLIQAELREIKKMYPNYFTQ